MDVSLNTLLDTKLFSTLDLQSGYCQVPMQPNHQEKMAFSTSSDQLYEFSVLPFGFCNTPTTFAHLMEALLSGKPALPTWMTSSSSGEHGKSISSTFRKSYSVSGTPNSSSNPPNARGSVEFLGHVVSPDRLDHAPSKVQALYNLTPPQSTSRQSGPF